MCELLQSRIHRHSNVTHQIRQMKFHAFGPKVVRIFILEEEKWWKTCLGLTWLGLERLIGTLWIWDKWVCRQTTHKLLRCKNCCVGKEYCYFNDTVNFCRREKAVMYETRKQYLDDLVSHAYPWSLPFSLFLLIPFHLLDRRRIHECLMNHCSLLSNTADQNNSS